MDAWARTAQSDDIQLNLKLNRALFAKDAGEALILFSDWMKENALTLPKRFVLPRYIADQLVHVSDGHLYLPRIVSGDDGLGA